MRTALGRLGLPLLLSSSVLAGCVPDLGECDLDAAEEVVFLDTGTNVDAENGWPLYAGQALIVQSCGNGQFCHSANAVGGFRYGAPKGLDFDLNIACTERDCALDDPNLGRLERGQREVLEHAHLLYRTADLGTMPPGDAGDDVAARAPEFRRVPLQLDEYDLRSHRIPCAQLPAGTCAPGEVSKEFPNPMLPHVTDRAGVEILRNWLACGAPVVESTDEGGKEGSSCAVDELGHQGNCVYRVDAPIDPNLTATWSSLFNSVLYPRCGTSCHNPADPAFGDSDLALVDAHDAYVAMFNQEARGTECKDSTVSPYPLVAPFDPDGSLLYQKLRYQHFTTTLGRPVCGDAMPTGRGSIAPFAIERFREWIEAGALEN